MVIAALVLGLIAPGVHSDEGRELVRSVCLDCHAGAKAKGNYDLRALLDGKPLAADLFQWRRAKAMVAANAMPPESDLDPDERAAMGEFFASIERQALELGGAAGHEPVRRLTRGELGNSLHELLGVRVDIEGLLPPELVAEGGFEASSATLQVHPEWLERARAAVLIALGETALDPVAFNLELFLRRAFRRPPTQAELARYGGNADLDATLAQVLASPHFLLRLEDVDAHGQEREVSPFGLASRLSFSLWNAPPDDELLDLAAAGSLGQDAQLAAQLARLLEDPRGRAFGESFAGQWLGTQGLGTRVKPDPIDNPQMTDSLLAAMRGEVALFVRALFVEGRPLEDLLRADFTFVTPELARFYGLKREGSGGFTRINLIDVRRRGVLGKAGVLASTSYPERTSAVLRGAWILDDLLGTPPPPPPPGVSELSRELREARAEHGPRGVLELHRAPSSCAGCHAQIDPLGFALDGFDHFGRIRGDRDTSGRLPSGAEFRGPSALARVLLEERRRDLALETARRLLSYALARPLTWRDERTVVDLGRTLEQEGFGALMWALVNCRPFRFIGPS